MKKLILLCFFSLLSFNITLDADKDTSCMFCYKSICYDKYNDDAGESWWIADIPAHTYCMNKIFPILHNTFYKADFVKKWMDEDNKIALDDAYCKFIKIVKDACAPLSIIEYLEMRGEQNLLRLVSWIWQALCLEMEF